MINQQVIIDGEPRISSNHNSETDSIYTSFFSFIRDENGKTVDSNAFNLSMSVASAVKLIGALQAGVAQATAYNMMKAEAEAVRNRVDTESDNLANPAELINEAS